MLCIITLKLSYNIFLGFYDLREIIPISVFKGLICYFLQNKLPIEPQDFADSRCCIMYSILIYIICQSNFKMHQSDRLSLTYVVKRLF